MLLDDESVEDFRRSLTAIHDDALTIAAYAKAVLADLEQILSAEE